MIVQLLAMLLTAADPPLLVDKPPDPPRIETQDHGDRVASGDAVARPDAALSIDQLDDLRAGQGVELHMLTNQTLTATNSDNSVNGDTVTSGDITLNTDAFQGFSGIGNFVMNTGHNNNLQGSISVQVVVVPQTP